MSLSEKKLDEILERVHKARTAIVEHIGEVKGPCQGTFPCPLCGQGRIFYRRATNGHIAGRCENKSCVNFME